ncbi:MAG: dienelactone hydrolase [Pirellulaceae bacterium]
MLSLFFVALTALQSGNYDPTATRGTVEVVDVEFTYGKEDREVPLRIYLPEVDSAAPVLLFSHGLGGSRDNNKYLGNHWAGRGYVVVVMQHAGSDTKVITEAPRLQRFAAIKSAASGENLLHRIRDVKETLDHLESLNRPGGAYDGRFDLTKVGMSGHSFGAVTTEAVSGQSFGRLGQPSLEKRIKAAVAFSPSPPAAGNDSNSFSKVQIPWLLMTGTKDQSPIGKRTDPESRRLVFKQLPKSNMFYELVFDGGEHSLFSDFRVDPNDRLDRKRKQAIQAISTAFWDAYLKGDDGALEWLDHSGPSRLLDSADVWQKK